MLGSIGIGSEANIRSPFPAGSSMWILSGVVSGVSVTASKLGSSISSCDGVCSPVCVL